MTVRVVLVMTVAATVAAARTASASEATGDRQDALHWNEISHSWECASLNKCADQPDLAEAKAEKAVV